jgi:CMP/dCMP kinase
LSRVIALNGDLAGGKTTVGKLLASHFGVNLVTMGTVQRQIAAERGITTLELNQLSESDPAIDQLIDGTVVELGESGRSLVMDSRLSWHFIPRAFKVHRTRGQ